VSQAITTASSGSHPSRRPDPPPHWQTPAALVGSAVLFFLGTGLAPIAVLAWIAPLPVFLLAPRRRARTAAAAAFAASLLGTSNMWAYYLTAKPIPIPIPIAVVIVLGTAALFTAATLVLRALVLRGRPSLAALAAPATWAGGLFLASLGAGGMDISSPTTQQTDLLPVLQIASLTGIYGVSFLVFLPAAAIAAAAAPATPRPARLRAAATGLVLVVAAIGYGIGCLAGAAGPSTTVAALGRIPQAGQQGQWDIDHTTPAGRDLLDSYVAAIRTLPADVRTVVLPEGVFSATGAARAALIDPLAAVAQARHSDLIVGAIDRTRPGGKWANSAFVIPADGAPVQQYVKHHDTGPRIEAGTLLTTIGHDGVAICMDLNYPDPARCYAAAGARRLLLPASDTDVDGRWHARVAVARGVENGAAVVWAANRGTSLIADATGRVLASADTAAPNRGPFAVAVASLPDGPGATPYTRYGDWFPWLCLIVVALCGLCAAPKGRLRS